MIAMEAVLPKKQALGHELDPLRLPGSFGVVGDAAAFCFYRHGLGDCAAVRVVIDADQVELGRDPQGVGTQRDGSGNEGRFVAALLGRMTLIWTTPSCISGVRGPSAVDTSVRQDVVESIHTPMDVPAFDRVHIVGPAALDMHQMEETRAVGVLVEHADGEEGRVILRPGWGRRGLFWS